MGGPNMVGHLEYVGFLFNRPTGRFAMPHIGWFPIVFQAPEDPDRRFGISDLRSKCFFVKSRKPLKLGKKGWFKLNDARMGINSPHSSWLLRLQVSISKLSKGHVL